MHRADLIRAKMGEKNLSKSALARAAGLNPNTVAAICRGDEVMPSTLKKAADVLELTLAELYQEEEPAAA
jgi:transcriptional regulator with XRE-family HTH domain